MSSRRKLKIQGEFASEGNPLLREQKKNAYMCELGLEMKYSNAWKKKKTRFPKWVRGIWDEHVHNPEKRKKDYFGIRVGG